MPLTKISKEINVKNVHKSKTKSVKTKLKEYENLKNLIKSLLKRNFSYISILNGGFYEVHSLALKWYIPLLNHDDNDCYICHKDTKDSKIEDEDKGEVQEGGKERRASFFDKLFTHLHDKIKGLSNSPESTSKLDSNLYPTHPRKSEIINPNTNFFSKLLDRFNEKVKDYSEDIDRALTKPKSLKVSSDKNLKHIINEVIILSKYFKQNKQLEKVKINRRSSNVENSLNEKKINSVKLPSNTAIKEYIGPINYII